MIEYEVVAPIVFFATITVLPFYTYLYYSGNSLNLLTYFGAVVERNSISRELKVEHKRIILQMKLEALDRWKEEGK